MKRVAVFGNAGGGKSTLARRLAELTRLPLYPLDMIQFRPGGGEVPRDDFLKAHTELLQRCHRHLTPKYRQLVAESRGAKRVHHLRSVNEMDTFLDAVRLDAPRA